MKDPNKPCHPEDPRFLRAEGPMQLPSAPLLPSGCTGPSLEVLGKAEDSDASG
jgi:hypothetical protein